MNTDLIDLKLKNLNERYSTEPEKFELWAIPLNGFWDVKHKGEGKSFKRTKTKGPADAYVIEFQYIYEEAKSQENNNDQ